MTELLESIVPPALEHPENESKACPFCPVPEPAELTTYPGEANDSDKLESVMVKPENLDQYQANAWPHIGKWHPTRETIEGRYRHEKYGRYEFQAHHLVSGKQALMNHAYERWISAEQGTIKKDTGYTINGSRNGIWAPSYPKSFRDGTYRWTGAGSVGLEGRKQIARYVMDAASCQFHLGHHAIDPRDGPEQIHDKYDKYLKDNLTEMDSRMEDWSKVCPVCKKDEAGNPQKPFDPNERANVYLYNLAGAAERQITAPKEEWMIFLSALARDYHKDFCAHHPRTESEDSL